MKPQAIRWFDGLFLGSMAFSAVDAVMQWPLTMAELESQPGMAEGGLALAIGIGMVVIGFGLYLLLWYGISLKQSRVAKWIMVVLAVLTALASAAPFLLPEELPDAWPFLAANALLIAATVTLFLPGAADWFRPHTVSPETFE